MNKTQYLEEGMIVYDAGICAPNRSSDSKGCYGIHFCEHSWHDAGMLKRLAHKFRGLSRLIRIYLSK